MATHRISVSVDKNSIRVDPETLTMTSADEVHWAGTNARKFSIVFDHEGVFGRRELDHAFATSRQRARIKGRFKYTVVSADDPNLKLDPIIVVEDPPTGPIPPP
jgi:hypothetical protein